jgi:hypothetical protein
MSTEDVSFELADNNEKESSNDESHNNGDFSSVQWGTISDDFDKNSMDCDGSVLLNVGNPSKDVHTKRSYKSKLDKIGLTDAFITECPILRNLIETRMTRINEERAFVKTILAPVDYFQHKMEREIAKLVRCQEECTIRINRDKEKHKSNVRQSMERFFMDHM